VFRITKGLSSVCSLSFLLAVSSGSAAAQAPPTVLSERIQKIIERPEFAHANFGIEFVNLGTGKIVYSLNNTKMFVPASTTKIFTEGALLSNLGREYRFHTYIYRTGAIDPKGMLKGNLVLVASGDPNLSNRIQPDGTLSFQNDDHTYGGPVVNGDPLAVIKELASAVAASKIRKIEGRVLVDASLLPDGVKEPGTGVVVSSIVVNDNVIDLVAKPAANVGDPVVFESSPHTSYVKFVNNLTTSAPGTPPNFTDPQVSTNPDGTVTATLTGSMPADAPAATATFSVPSPTKFAETVLTESLKDAGVEIKLPKKSSSPDFTKLASYYTPENRVAEHVSPPLSEEIKVTLKISQNLHAALGIYLLGSIAGKDVANPLQSGFKVEKEFFKSANLDLSGASQGDGAGGDAADYFSPEFTCRYLQYWASRPDYESFFNALPILGKDGTLSDIQTKSVAAGHVFAKTGTLRARDRLNDKPWLRGKALAGYVNTINGEYLVFAAYINNVSLPPDPESADRMAGQALGEIAAAAYDSSIKAEYDLIIRNGHLIDGTGNPWFAADLGVKGERIAVIGDLHGQHASREIDASGRVVAPGFIDMLGQSEVGLLLDNRSLSKLSQGITTEITGENATIAPQSEKTLAAMKPFLTSTKLDVDWTTFDGYFRRLEKQGTPMNLGSYVGAAQLRAAVIGYDNRPPSDEELEKMKSMTVQAMKDGALGLSTALVYPPATYAKTDEIIALAKVAAQYGGLYATHMRSEGTSEIRALDETVRIGREAKLPVEIFHLKVMGEARWGNMKDIVARIQTARDSGLDIAANMYPYVAGSTALSSALPPWVGDGGKQKFLERLKDPEIRARIKKELTEDHSDWENFYLDAGGAKGKTLDEIAKTWKKSPIDALMDFVLADPGRTDTIYFIASEDDLRLGLTQPWTSIGLDYGQMSLDGPMHETHGHPRAFGSVPRFLGRYVRDEHLMTLEAAIRKLTSLPAQREHLAGRGQLQPGFYADIVIFDPQSIIDRATYAVPDQLSEGIDFTIVNGQIEYDHGKLTGVTSGKILRGRGWHPEERNGALDMSR
jgi:N-acyl-D-amino-acid deacylase